MRSCFFLLFFIPCLISKAFSQGGPFKVCLGIYFKSVNHLLEPAATSEKIIFKKKFLQSEMTMEITKSDYDLAKKVLLSTRKGAIPLPIDELEELIAGFYNAAFGRGLNIGTGRSFEDYLLWLKKLNFKAQDLKNKIIADLGAGTSNFTDVAKSQYGAKKTIAVDLMFHPNFQNPHTGSPWKPNVSSLNEFPKLSERLGVSFTNLPFNDGSIDIFVTSASFYFLPENALLQSLNEVSRCLKKGGKAYIPQLDEFQNPSVKAKIIKIFNNHQVRLTVTDESSGSAYIAIQKDP